MSVSKFSGQVLHAWHAHRDQWQIVINERFVPERAEEREWPHPRKVVAHVVWEHDGLQEIETIARASAGDLICVRIDDPRRFIRDLWLHLPDVELL